MNLTTTIMYIMLVTGALTALSHFRPNPFHRS